MGTKDVPQPQEQDEQPKTQEALSEQVQDSGLTPETQQKVTDIITNLKKGYSENGFSSFRELGGLLKKLEKEGDKDNPKIKEVSEDVAFAMPEILEEDLEDMKETGAKDATKFDTPAFKQLGYLDSYATKNSPESGDIFKEIIFTGTTEKLKNANAKTTRETLYERNDYGLVAGPIRRIETQLVNGEHVSEEAQKAFAEVLPILEKSDSYDKEDKYNSRFLTDSRIKRYGVHLKSKGEINMSGKEYLEAVRKLHSDIKERYSEEL